MKENLEHTNEPKRDLTLNWTFWERIISCSLYPVQWNTKVVVNIHGTYWNKDGTNGKYESFAEELQQNGISAVTYSSSRTSNTSSDIVDPYEKKKSQFIWKTFQDELEDARRVVQWVIQSAKEQLWVEPEHLEITLNGNSLGWILAFYLANEFTQVKAISSVWTWIRLEKTDVPILSSLPDAEEVKTFASRFTWRYIMHQAWADSVFSDESYKSLYAAVWSDQKAHIFYDSVWHSFRTADDNESIKPYETVRDEVVKLSWNQKISDMIVYLEKEVDASIDSFSKDLRSILVPYDEDEIDYVG